jgi:hypothetical protein
MSSISELRATLRDVDRSKYPALSDYNKEEIWRDIGPGGLYLVSLAAQALKSRPMCTISPSRSGRMTF